MSLRQSTILFAYLPVVPTISALVYVKPDTLLGNASQICIRLDFRRQGATGKQMGNRDVRRKRVKFLVTLCFRIRAACGRRIYVEIWYNKDLAANLMIKHLPSYIIGMK